MAEITIEYDDQYVLVSYQPKFKPWLDAVEIVYVDKDTSMEDVAQGFLEVAAALNATTKMEEI